MNITKEQLMALIESKNNSSIVTLVTKTEPKMRKTNNPFFGKLKHIARRNGIIGCSYENSVNNQREREGGEDDVVEHFRAEGLWKGKGEHVGRFLVRHKESGQMYLAFFPRSNSEGDVVLSESQFVDDEGKEVDREKLKPFLYSSEQPSTQQTMKAIPWRVISIDNILQLTMNGETFVVK